MLHYLLMYDLSPEYMQKRGQWRAEHLALAWAAQKRGELVLAGPLNDPVDGAVLLFKGETPAAAEAFAAADPYVKNGLILRWRVRPWTTTVGDDAVAPVK